MMVTKVYFCYFRINRDWLRGNNVLIGTHRTKNKKVWRAGKTFYWVFWVSASQPRDKGKKYTKLKHFCLSVVCSRKLIVDYRWSYYSATMFLFIIEKWWTFHQTQNWLENIFFYKSRNTIDRKKQQHTRLHRRYNDECEGKVRELWENHVFLMLNDRKQILKGEYEGSERNWGEQRSSYYMARPENRTSLCIYNRHESAFCCLNV